MIADLTAAAAAVEAADVVVIGAGAAGITLALQLSTTGRRVVVLEGGQRVQTEASQARYRGRLTVGAAMHYPPLDANRLRMFGGTTNHWGGWCRPLEPNVFGARSGVSDTGWPIGRDELEPYYRRAAELCQLGRPEWDPAVLCAAAVLPTPFAGDHVIEPVAWRYSPPTRFGEAYGLWLEATEVEVYLGANVVQLSTAAGRVTDVVAVDEAGGTHRVGARQVVLACGAIENCRQLLQLAAIVPALDASGLLGVGFMEHPHVPLGYVLAGPEDVAPAGWLAACLELQLDGADGGLFMIGAAVGAAAAAEHRMANVSFTFADVTAWRAQAEYLGAVRTLWAGASGRVPTTVSVFARAEQRFDPASRVRLDTATDDLGQRRAMLDWRVTPADLADIATARRLLSDALARAGLGPSRLVDDPPANIDGGGHHIGGTRMHHSASHGVVDADGRCHALDNPYVAGSSTFPTACFSNPTLTIVALAVRLAEHIAALDGR